MTTGAQQALRRTMEIYSSTTRFAFACNQSNKIIEPIQSRCAILRYSRLTDQELLKRLLEICAIEKVRGLSRFALNSALTRLKYTIRFRTMKVDSLPSYLHLRVT